MTDPIASHRGFYNNLKPDAKRAAVADIQKAVEQGGIDRIIAVELRNLFLELTERKQA
jgi:hypothetical protein